MRAEPQYSSIIESGPRWFRSRSNPPAECLEKSIEIMKMWKDVISNSDKQRKRMEKQTNTGISKSGKKGVFKGAAQRLLSVGGGNKTAPSCSGSTTNDGAAQLKNLTDFLFGCEAAVHEACNSTNFAGLVNKTKLEQCKSLSATSKTGAEACLGKTVGVDKTNPEDACACWTNSTLVETIQAAKMCKFSNEARVLATALKTCKNKFSECRKYEDAAAETILACSTDADTLIKEVGRVFITEIMVKITTVPY